MTADRNKHDSTTKEMLQLNPDKKMEGPPLLDKQTDGDQGYMADMAREDDERLRINNMTPFLAEIKTEIGVGSSGGWPAGSAVISVARDSTVHVTEQAPLVAGLLALQYISVIHDATVHVTEQVSAVARLLILQ
ncbi:hypothetical protein NDU88_008912 [Pleurodeles waltl]|uniref:Uncharacterized protein n=1 Tax=Pleurodeles waltl TaxID=8319 RepID=A0AAV7P4Y3_PLEWA|nr:hypothetical protein NDU88_008912 [Pleurodeles waltl]